MKNKQTSKNVASIAVPVLDTKAIQAVKAKIATAESKVEAARAELHAEQAALREILSAFNTAMSASLGVNVLTGISPVTAASNGGQRGSQKQAVIDLLLAGPISCKDIAAKVGTSEHNIQGTLTGIRRGTPITAEKVNGVTVYSLPA
jgi:hypothetical protein